MREININRVVNISNPKEVYRKLEEAELIEEQTDFLESHLQMKEKFSEEFEAWVYMKKGKNNLIFWGNNNRNKAEYV